MYGVLAQKWFSKNKSIHCENWYLNHNCLLVTVVNSRNPCPVYTLSNPPTAKKTKTLFHSSYNKQKIWTVWAVSCFACRNSVGAGTSYRRPSHCAPQGSETHKGKMLHAEQDACKTVSGPAASESPLLTRLKSDWSHPAPGEDKGVSEVRTSLTPNWKNIAWSWTWKCLCYGPHWKSLPLKGNGS